MVTLPHKPDRMVEQLRLRTLASHKRVRTGEGEQADASLSHRRDRV